MSLPNMLTKLRFALIPIFIFTFFSSSSRATLYSLIIFLLAGITDMLDGYLARKYNSITKWGQAMDPLADKLMQMTVLICFTIKSIVPLWIVIIVFIKEALMVTGGLFLYHKMDNLVIPANKFGKQATVFFYFAITWLALQLPYGVIIISASVLFTAFAFINYSKLALKELKAKNLQKTKL